MINFFADLFLIAVVGLTVFVSFIAGRMNKKRGSMMTIAIAMGFCLFLMYGIILPINEKDTVVKTTLWISQKNLINNFYKLGPGNYRIADFKKPTWYPLIKDSLAMVSISTVDGHSLLIPSKKLKIEFYHPTMITHVENGKTMVQFLSVIENDILEIKQCEVHPGAFENFATVKLLR